MSLSILNRSLHKFATLDGETSAGVVLTRTGENIAIMARMTLMSSTLIILWLFIFDILAPDCQMIGSGFERIFPPLLITLVIVFHKSPNFLVWIVALVCDSMCYAVTLALFV